MKRMRFIGGLSIAILGLLLTFSSSETLGQPDPKKENPFGKEGPFGKDGPFGKGGFGGPGGGTREIIKDYDKDGDGKLNTDERKVAREAMKKGGGGGFGKGGFGKGGFGKGGEAGKPGPKVTPEEVKNYPDAKFYDPKVLRTIFIEFDNKTDWEQELADFYHTDVKVPANITVDGKKYSGVGISFRGASSYFTVGAGSKRSLNLDVNFTDDKQRLYGYKSLNLLNSHEDPTMMSTVLYSHIAGQYIPTPKANFVKVVINGESWGVYASVQQFNKEFTSENFKSTKGARWKVKGSPGGGGGLDYLGDKIESYKSRYDMKAGDEKDWKAFIELLKVLNQTPADKLEEALKPILDVEGVLMFLALDNALINCDGYWIRASDYSIYRDEKGKFHILPHDMNEAFRPAMGPGFGGGGPGGKGGFGPPGGGFPGFPGGGDAPPFPKDGPPMGKDGPMGKGGFGGGRGNVELDPLVGITDARKPLRSKLLAVPAFKKQYLANVKKIAEESLDWKKLGPVVADYRKLIEKEVEADTRKLESYSAFKATTADEPPASGFGGGFPLKTFAENRRKYLLSHDEIKKLSP